MTLAENIDRDAVAAELFGGVDTVTSRVKALIRRDIVNGHLKPGSRVKLGDLADRYRISAVPVREAIRELSGEDLISIQPHKGAVVRGANIALVRSLYEIKTAIAVMLVEKAVLAVTDDDLHRVEQAMLAYERVAAGEVLASLEANAEFHEAINIIARNGQAVRIMKHGWELITALRVRFGMNADQAALTVKSHRQQFEALRDRDVGLLVHLTRAHLAGACEALVMNMLHAGMD